MKDVSKEIEDAIWAGDTEKLHELAPCHCCCGEHTFKSCPPRVWHGCRGSNSEEPPEYDDYRKAFPDLPWDQD